MDTKMADLAVPVDNSRVKGVTIIKPIVFGNVSQYFGKKRESDGHTHWWNVYVKPYNEDEDMSQYIKKIHFKLHESYANPQRVVVKPPYEVSETGWGEFEVIIKIYFVDPSERPLERYEKSGFARESFLHKNLKSAEFKNEKHGKPTLHSLIANHVLEMSVKLKFQCVTLYHLLKLFHADAVLQHQVPRKQLVSELYDEMIFQDPSQLMYKYLTSGRKLLTPVKQETDWKEKERKTLDSISNARKRVAEEITQVKERLKRQKNGIQTLKEEIQKLEKPPTVTTTAS